MNNDVFISGKEETTTINKISQMLDGSDTDVFVFASAYVSRQGIEQLNSVLSDSEISQCAGVFGLDDYVTQPSAIERARDLDWDVRVSGGGGQNFHPKLAVAGPSWGDFTTGYIGSGNFTKGGFENNVEVGAILNDASTVEDLGEVAVQLLAESTSADDYNLDEYAEEYAERARQRSTKDPRAGVGEPTPTTESMDPKAYEDWQEPEDPVYDPKHATAAWAGLQSFTGEYKFQLEFPKIAAMVVRELVGGEEGEIIAWCEDQKTRIVEYKFREDNGMFRLEIPNEVPRVDLARERKEGICLVEDTDHPSAQINLRIITDNREASEFIHRSMRENSWGETRTRLYGWF